MIFENHIKGEDNDNDVDVDDVDDIIATNDDRQMRIPTIIDDIIIFPNVAVMMMKRCGCL